MPTMVGPLPAGTLAVLGLAGVAIYLAGKDMNRQSTVILQDRPVAYPLFPFGRRGFRRRRDGDHLNNSGITPEDSGYVDPNIPQPPPLEYDPSESPITPGSDPAVPPYTDTVFSPTVPQTATGLTYVNAGQSDNLYTLSSRLYNNPRRAVDIFNANRAGVQRADGSPGVMAAPGFIEPGTRLIIP